MKTLLLSLSVLLAVALRPCWSAEGASDPTSNLTNDTTRAAVSTDQPQPWLDARHQNSTEGSSAELRVTVGSAADPAKGLGDSGERAEGELDQDREGDDASAAPDGRVAELYEDLEDSVVFEDSEGHGSGGRLPEEDLVPVDHSESASATSSSSSSPSTEEYDTAADEEDAVPAGTSPVVQRLVKFPEYVRSSSYRRGWPGGNVTRPEELFRFWDPYEWTATSKVSTECADQMELYQTALRNGKMWAYKSEFATNIIKRYCILTDARYDR